MSISKTLINNDGESLNIQFTQYEINELKKQHNIEYVEDLAQVINKLLKQQFNT